MFSADPFSNIPFCGSTLAPVFPFVKRDIQRGIISLCMPKIALDLGTSTYADRVVITLKITDLDLNLNRK